LDVRGRKWREAGEYYIMSFIICFIEYYSGDYIKEDEMGVACGRNMGEITIFWLGRHH
jgi:hypothetical protein